MTQGRIALVTGGASGIGKASCERLAADGFTLAVCDLNGAGAAEVAGEGGLGRSVDVVDQADVDAFVADVLDRFGKIDVLVNNAGIAGNEQATVLHATPVDEWDRVLAVNVRGPYLFARAVLPSMIERRDGHIITIASIAGQVAFPARSAYTTSKGAALQMARSMAIDYAPYGIRSNAVCPGMTYTGMTSWRLDDDRLRQSVEDRVPLGRVATADDIADAVALLASGRMSYMTGSALVIDGGWSAQ